MAKKILTEQIHEQQVSLKEQTAPSSPATGYVRVYAKSDGRLYAKDDAGTEYALSIVGEMYTNILTTLLSGASWQVDNTNVTFIDINSTTETFTITGDVMTLKGVTELRLETPALASATNGDFLQLVDKTTGKVEFATAPSGSDPLDNITVITANTTLNSSHEIIQVDCSSATSLITVTLPDPASTAVGKKYLIEYAVGGTSYYPEVVCVTSGAMPTIGPSYQMFTLYSTFYVINDGTYWQWINTDVETRAWVTAVTSGYITEDALKPQVSSIATDTTVGIDIPQHQIIRVDTTAGDVTVTLPPNANILNLITIKKVSSDANKVIILPDGAETIDGDTSAEIHYRNSTVTMMADDTGNISIISK